jgi:uncharacterized protein YkwD
MALALLLCAGVTAAYAAGYAAVSSRAQLTLTASTARHPGARNDVRGQRACGATRHRRKRRARCHSHSRTSGGSQTDYSGGTPALRSHASHERRASAPRSERDQLRSQHNSATDTKHETTAHAEHIHTGHTHTRRSAQNSATNTGHETTAHAEHIHTGHTHTRRSAQNSATNTGHGGTSGAGHGHSVADANAGTHTAAVDTAEAPATARESRIEKILATPCENTELTPTPENLAEVDAATLCLINQERARHDERPLRTNRRLEQAAQGHSEEMIADDYFAHVAPDGVTPVQRIEATGYIPNAQAGYTIGENIAWGTLALSTPSSIVAAWIASPEHLANILYAPYRDTGIGVVAAVPASLAEGQPGAMYSQEFGVIEH